MLTFWMSGRPNARGRVLSKTSWAATHSLDDPTTTAPIPMTECECMRPSGCPVVRVFEAKYRETSSAAAIESPGDPTMTAAILMIECECMLTFRMSGRPSLRGRLPNEASSAAIPVYEGF
jgi:hypothetical protein